MSTAELGGIKVGGGKVAIIGAINLSPNSFYPGSIARSPREALKRAEQMLAEGADLVDVGAMSTRPGAKAIPLSLELKRLLPTVKLLTKRIKAPISVDTQRAEVARAVLEAGAEVINDVSGLKTDPAMAEVLADFKCSAILMAARERPGDVRSMHEIKRELGLSLRICKAHGIRLRKVLVDPGIGFGKGAKWDLRILARLEELKSLWRPICVAVSRKSFIGEVLGLPNPSLRLWGSLAATAIAVLHGAEAIRTHDPKETRHASLMAQAIRSEAIK